MSNPPPTPDPPPSISPPPAPPGTSLEGGAGSSASPASGSSSAEIMALRKAQNRLSLDSSGAAYLAIALPGTKDDPTRPPSLRVSPAPGKRRSVRSKDVFSRPAPRGGSSGSNRGKSSTSTPSSPPPPLSPHPSDSGSGKPQEPEPPSTTTTSASASSPNKALYLSSPPSSFPSSSFITALPPPYYVRPPWVSDLPDPPTGVENESSGSVISSSSTTWDEEVILAWVKEEEAARESLIAKQGGATQVVSSSGPSSSASSPSSSPPPSTSAPGPILPPKPLSSTSPSASPNGRPMAPSPPPSISISSSSTTTTPGALVMAGGKDVTSSRSHTPDTREKDTESTGSNTETSRLLVAMAGRLRSNSMGSEKDLEAVPDLPTDAPPKSPRPHGLRKTANPGLTEMSPGEFEDPGGDASVYAVALIDDEAWSSESDSDDSSSNTATSPSDLTPAQSPHVGRRGSSRRGSSRHASAGRETPPSNDSSEANAPAGASYPQIRVRRAISLGALDAPKRRTRSGSRGRHRRGSKGKKPASSDRRSALQRFQRANSITANMPVAASALSPFGLVPGVHSGLGAPSSATSATPHNSSPSTSTPGSPTNSTSPLATPPVPPLPEIPGVTIPSNNNSPGTSNPGSTRKRATSIAGAALPPDVAAEMMGMNKRFSWQAAFAPFLAQNSPAGSRGSPDQASPAPRAGRTNSIRAKGTTPEDIAALARKLDPNSLSRKRGAKKTRKGLKSASSKKKSPTPASPAGRGDNVAQARPLVHNPQDRRGARGPSQSLGPAALRPPTLTGPAFGDAPREQTKIPGFVGPLAAAPDQFSSLPPSTFVPSPAGRKAREQAPTVTAFIPGLGAPPGASGMGGANPIVAESPARLGKRIPGSSPPSSPVQTAVTGRPGAQPMSFSFGGPSVTAHIPGLGAPPGAMGLGLSPVPMPSDPPGTSTSSKPSSSPSPSPSSTPAPPGTASLPGSGSLFTAPTSTPGAATLVPSESEPLPPAPTPPPAFIAQAAGEAPPTPTPPSRLGAGIYPASDDEEEDDEVSDNEETKAFKAVQEYLQRMARTVEKLTWFFGESLSMSDLQYMGSAFSYREYYSDLNYELSLSNKPQQSQHVPVKRGVDYQDLPDLLFTQDDQGEMLIRGGTLKKLVDRLTWEKAADPAYLTDFLLTYRSFTTPTELLRLLIRRFSIHPSPSLSEKDAHKFMTTRQTPIRARVFNVLKTWVDRHFYDFSEDPTLTRHLLTFVSKTMATVMAAQAAQLKNAIKKKIEGAGRKLQRTPHTSAPAPIIPANTNVRFMTIHDIDPVEMARQLALIEYELFAAIQPKELLANRFASANKHKEAPNAVALTNHFNNLVYWVATTVVQEPESRSNVLKYWINVAESSRVIGNYNGVTEIIAGLHLGPVYRLKGAWGSLAAKERKLLASLKELTSQYQNFGRMRYALRHRNPPCIPYIGIFLSDLTFIASGNPDWLDQDRTLVNFVKRRKSAGVLRELALYQQEPLDFHVEPIVAHFLTKAKALAEDELYAVSRKVEPPRGPRHLISTKPVVPGGTDKRASGTIRIVNGEQVFVVPDRSKTRNDGVTSTQEITSSQ